MVLRRLMDVAQLKERLLVLKLGDRSALGKSATLLAEIYRRELKPSLIIAGADGGSDVVAELSRALEAFEKAVQPVVAERVMQALAWHPHQGTGAVNARGTGEDCCSDSAKTCSDAEGAEKATDLRRKHWLRRREWRAPFDPGGEHGDRAVRENRCLRTGLQQ